MCYLNITDLSVPFISSLLHLRELDVTFCYGITISGLQTLVKGVPNLESFCFKIGKKADQDTDPAVVFQSLGRFCPRLRALKCRSDAFSINDNRSVIRMFAGCPLLEKFEVVGQSPSDKALIALGHS